MKISIEDVSRLARLSLTEAEQQQFGPQLEGILTYMDTLNELDTTGIEPTSHVIPIGTVTREDAPRPSLAPEEALANAPERTERLYRVPKIIE